MSRCARASLTSWCAFDIASEEATLQDLEAQSSDPGLWDNQENARSVMQRLARLRERVDTWRKLEQRVNDTAELIELSQDEDDPEVEAQLRQEVEDIRSELQKLEFQLLLSGDYDDRDAILAVHAGAGGTESQDWAEMLMRMYVRWAEQHGYTVDVIDTSEGEEAGIKSVTLEIRGEWAYGRLRAERGVHRLVRISPFDSSGSRHTSFAKVEVMPVVEQSGEVEVNPDDLRVDVFRASGHGGQNVQKNSTAIRITHLPTGIVVQCQNERSQGRNRELAMKVLEARLLELELERQEEERAKLKGEHVDMAFGNQIRSYVLQPYKMVKDHRTEYETSDASSVLEGNLDGFIESYLRTQIGEGE